MRPRVMLLGRTPFDPDQVQAALDARLDVDIVTGTSLEDVRSAFDDSIVDVVIMGAGIPLADRLAVIDHIYTVSDATTVHMKDRASGMGGMMPFVNQVLAGLTTDR